MLLDCDGRNISQKNGNYSELTVLYWIWKNQLISGCDKAEYYGLAHYRRILELTEDDMLRLENNEVDVVLPYPMRWKRYIQNMLRHFLPFYVSNIFIIIILF